MPKGVYDRSESKMRRLEEERARLREEIGRLKSEAAKRPGGEEEHRFQLLRANLHSLSETRQSLLDSESVNDGLVQRIDAEIERHLGLLVTMREKIFSAEDAGQQQARALAEPTLFPQTPRRQARTQTSAETVVAPLYRPHR